MFTLLCYNKTKMLLGNRKGEVFVADSKWFWIYPTIFILPICVSSSNASLVIPEHSGTSPITYCKDDTSEVAENPIMYRILKFQSMECEIGGIRLSSRCAFDNKQNVWYTAGIPAFIE